MDKYKNFIKKNIGLILAVIITIFALGYTCYDTFFNKEPETVTYNEFLEYVNKDEVTEVKYKSGSPKITFITTDDEEFVTDNPRKEDFKEMLLLKDVEFTELQDPFGTSILKFILNYGYILLLGGIVIMTMRQTQTPAGKYKVEPSSTNVKLDDVIIPNNVKKDILRNIDFLKNPKKYEECGAKMPKGMLLVGPPGTGKTMIAKAIANEAGTPFFYASGSDFIELYVGQGARRIRSLFKEAKENAPCVIFIDEIDAIGGVRGNKNNTENDQSINCLLTCLDGFSSSEGILVIAATNRADVLDPGLTREGRFDQHVNIPLPNKQNRSKIIELNINKIKMKNVLDVDEITKKTFGFSGATIASLINESVLIAIDNGKDTVTMDDLNIAFKKIVFKSHQNDETVDDDEASKKEKWLCAVHEAGHALVSQMMCDINVTDVSIIGTLNGAGGFTMNENEEKGIYTYKDLLNKILVLYSGSAAEMVVFNEKSTGASNDFERATELIRDMINKYGMGNDLLVSDVIKSKNIDEENISQMQELAKSMYDKCCLFLTINKNILIRIAEDLMAKESIDHNELMRCIEGE